MIIFFQQRTRSENKTLLLQQEKNVLAKQVESLLKEKMEMLKLKEKIDKYETSFQDFSLNLKNAQSEIISMKANQSESDRLSSTLREQLEEQRKENIELKNQLDKSKKQDVFEEELNYLQLEIQKNKV